MSEQRTDTQRCDASDIRQCMSIHTRKITDSCRDKDCIEDLRVYLTTSSQAILDSAANTRVRCAELITTYIDVEPVAFDRNHYCIDLTFYYRILADAVVSGSRPTTLQGLAVFSKRAVLCGEDSRAHIYRSDTRLGRFDGPPALFANLPTAMVDSADTKQAGNLAAFFPGGFCLIVVLYLHRQRNHRQQEATMKEFIPYEKLSKKEKRKLDQARRQTWGVLNPVTRKPANSRAYNRQKARSQIRFLPETA